MDKKTLNSVLFTYATEHPEVVKFLKDREKLIAPIMEGLLTPPNYDNQENDGHIFFPISDIPVDYAMRVMKLSLEDGGCKDIDRYMFHFFVRMMEHEYKCNKSRAKGVITTMAHELGIKTKKQTKHIHNILCVHGVQTQKQVKEIDSIFDRYNPIDKSIKIRMEVYTHNYKREPFHTMMAKFRIKDMPNNKKMKLDDKLVYTIQKTLKDIRKHVRHKWYSYSKSGTRLEYPNKYTDINHVINALKILNKEWKKPWDERRIADYGHEGSRLDRLIKGESLEEVLKEKE